MLCYSFKICFLFCIISSYHYSIYYYNELPIITDHKFIFVFEKISIIALKQKIKLIAVFHPILSAQPVTASSELYSGHKLQTSVHP